MSTELATRPSALSITEGQMEWTPKQIATLEQLGVTGAGEGDLAVFFHQAVRTGLDPFAKQIYMIGRWSREGTKWTIQTGIDGYRLVARRAADRAHELLEYEDTLWCGPDGRWRDVWLEQGPPAAAKVTVLRNGGRFPAIAMWNEYVQTNRDGGPNAMWARMGAGQLAKCAEALALRKAFPQDLSGIYTDEEMGQADARAEAEQSRAVPATRGVARSASESATPAALAQPAADQPDGTGQDCEAWQARIAAANTTDDVRAMWREAGPARDRDCGGETLANRMLARIEEIRAAEAAQATEQAADVPEDVPEGVGEPITGEAVEGEVVVEPDPLESRKQTGARRGHLAALQQLFGGNEETFRGACQQTFGLQPEDVSTVRLRDWQMRLSTTAQPA